MSPLALLFVCLLVGPGSSATDAATAAQPSPRAFAVAGYLPEWRYGGTNFDALFPHLSHLIFFSIEPLNDGKLSGLDRLPSAEVLADAASASRTHGTKLLLCLGGNGRSGGFSAATRSRKTRQRFVRNVVKLVDQLGLDGADVNWEYPGFQFQSGYTSDAAALAADWDGLASFVKELRTALRVGGKERLVTLAYYPDGRQEALLVERGLHTVADLMHSMAYDASGESHSPMSLANTTVEQAVRIFGAAGGAQAATLGLPFYGRLSTTGDWTTYEDIVQQHHPLDPGVDSVVVAVTPGAPPRKGQGVPVLAFNGVATIEAKTRLAIEAGLGGVMIWESGQDCRTSPVTRGGTTHVRTCPGQGTGDARDHDDAYSLHAAISRSLQAAGVARAFAPETPTAAATAGGDAVSIHGGGAEEL